MYIFAKYSSNKLTKDEYTLKFIQKNFTVRFQVSDTN